MDIPRVTFGIIVLNGEPFTRYCLRALYPFAHEIIVVEGASRHAAHMATDEGHSIDGTLQVLASFKSGEDPDNKLQVITRDGFWSEKDEQSQAYAERATGDYLWQVDIDEFFHPSDMEIVLRLIQAHPETTAVSFGHYVFWGGLDYVADSGARWVPWIRWLPRLFKWGQGYRYASHRPPTVVDADGRTLTEIQHQTFENSKPGGFFFYHYSMVFPIQIQRKAAYYERVKLADTDGMTRWAQENWRDLKHPLHVLHWKRNMSWLRRFEGEHPPQVERMRRDIQDGAIEVELRQTNDIEALLDSWWYPAACSAVIAFERLRFHLVNPLADLARRATNKLRRIMNPAAHSPDGTSP